MNLIINNVPEFQKLNQEMLKNGISKELIDYALRESIEYCYIHGTEVRSIDLENVKRLCDYAKI